MTHPHDIPADPSASTLGVAIPQVTARAKVLGRALYAGDLKLAGMLHGKVLRSPYPHARIVSIDTAAACALPGVMAVLTGDDAPAQLWGAHHKDRAVLAKGVVRYCGEEVAAVAAVSEEIARDALDLIQVEYEELPALFSVDEAMDEEAPPVHPGRANNIGHEIRFARGDVDAGFAAAHLIHEATYTTHSQYPGYLEPMASVAALDPDGRLVLWTSTQAVNLVRLQVAGTLGLPVSRVRVVQATTGGGFGGTQMLFALNSQIDAMARQLGLDPVDVHQRNAIVAGDVTVHGWEIGSAGLKECIDQATQALDWSAKRARTQPRVGVKRRGVGMAAAMHVSGNRTIGNWDGSTVIVRIHEDGQALVISGECDMGQGATTVIAQIVAHELSLPLSRVRVAAPDTDTAPFAVGTLASRVTMAAGNAAIRSARAARDKLLALASTLLEAHVDDLELFNGTVRVRGTDRAMDFAALARQHIWRHGGESLQVSASWDAQTTMHDANLYGNIAPAYSFAAQAVEVEVDTETGRVTVLDSYVADDCGKALNPIAVHGQTNGATVQAIGWALYEQLHYENGRLANGNFADYTMATAEAVPLLRGGFVESNDPNGPYGAKGASETAILPGAPAIANAVFDAVGVRITDLPITPEKVLAALRAGPRDATGATHA